MMSISKATIDSMIKDLPFPSNVLKVLKDDVIEVGVSKKEMEEIIEKIMEEYEVSCIEPCDAAGVIAAQSIGEPGTQMTMLSTTQVWPRLMLLSACPDL